MSPPAIDYDRLDPRQGSGFIVRAPSMERLFIHAALVLHEHLVTVPEKGGEVRSELAVEAGNLNDLLLEWLNAVYDVFQSQGIVVGQIVFRKFDGQKIEATLHGNRFEALKHGVKTGVEALSFHGVDRADDSDSASFSTQVFLEYAKVSRAS